jgi:hypothetical protein
MYSELPIYERSAGRAGNEVLEQLLKKTDIAVIACRNRVCLEGLLMPHTTIPRARVPTVPHRIMAEIRAEYSNHSIAVLVYSYLGFSL